MKNNKNIAKTDQKSRAKYKCPEELKNIIEKINLVPLNIEMKTFELFKVSLSELSEEFYEYLKTLPEDFKKQLRIVMLNGIEKYSLQTNSTESCIKLLFVLGIYQGFYDLRDEVKRFIIRVDRVRSGEDFDSITNPLRVTTTIDVTKTNGQIEVSLVGLAGQIGCFEADRLRICEICSRVFWAKRQESKTCSAKCFNNLRQQNYRKLSVEEKAERKARRDANRERNKKLKQLKEKNNGTL